MNWAQSWSLSYYYYMSRRQFRKDKEWELERQTYNLNYEFWEKVYKPEELQFSSGQISFGGIPVEEVGVDQVSAVDEYWESIGSKRSITGAEALAYDDDGRGKWV